MPIQVGGKLEGFEEINKQLKRLGEVVGGRVLKSAVGAAITPAIKEIKAAAPVGDRLHKTNKGRWVAPGFLSRSIKKKTWKNGRGTVAIASIGVDSEAWYGAQLVEQGYVATDRRGVQHKPISARPFIEPSFQRVQSVIINRLKLQLKNRIQKVLK